MSEDIRANYDRVAASYAAHFQNELDRKPFDRQMLALLIEKVGTKGVICDMGCGPGQVAYYLHAQGVEVCGVDLSPEMVQQARFLNPTLSFQTGDMLALTDVSDEAYGGIAAFYAIVNLPPSVIGKALKELGRVLRPHGVLLLTFHIGQSIKHVDELLGHSVAMDFYFFETDRVKEAIKLAGLTLEEVIEREPYPEDVEYPSRRAYIFARKT